MTKKPTVRKVVCTCPNCDCLEPKECLDRACPCCTDVGHHDENQLKIVEE